MTTGRQRWIALTTRLSLVALLLLLGLVVSWWLLWTSPTPERRGPEAGRPEAPVFRAQQVEVARQWRGYGTAEAMDAANVPARVTATVANVPEAIEAGRPVEQGDLLVRLDDSDFQHTLETAQQRIAELRARVAQLDVQEDRLTERLKLEREDAELARSDLERLRQLLQQDAANEQEVDAARREVIAAERAVVNTSEMLEQIDPRRNQLEAQIEGQIATRKQAELNVERTRIVSPIRGVLETVNVEEGENVMAGEPVARVVSLQRIEAPLRLPASARGDVAVDDPVTLEASASPGLTWTARVARISPTDDAETRTVTAYVELQQEVAAPTAQQRREMLAPGMFVEGIVTSQRTQRRWVVPRRAIRSGSIRVIGEDDRVASQAVDVAFVFEGRVPALELPEDRQWAALSGALTPGQLVMVSASSSVLDGQRVQPVLASQLQSARADTQDGAQINATSTAPSDEQGGEP